MAQHQSLYKQVVRISSIYLGPAADRFISRQVSYHLQKQPDELQAADLPELIDWIRLAMSFLTNDRRMINDFTNRLELLRHPSPSLVSVGRSSRTQIAGSRVKSHVSSA